MKRILIMLLLLPVLLIHLLPIARAQADTDGLPPVAQPLVRQGEFAVMLVKVLLLGPAGSGEQAQSTLEEIGVTPLEGWIADYPVTPSILGELENAVIDSGDSGALAYLDTDEAVKALRDLAAELGLPVVQNDEGTYAEEEVTVDYYEDLYDTVNNHYYHNGPPAVTYYLPPQHYYHLYTWVPYSFWYSKYRFPGFFILSDYHRAHKVHVANKPTVKRVTPYTTKHKRRHVVKGHPVTREKIQRVNRHRTDIHIFRSLKPGNMRTEGRKPRFVRKVERRRSGGEHGRVLGRPYRVQGRVANGQHRLSTRKGKSLNRSPAMRNRERFRTWEGGRRLVCCSSLRSK